MKCHLHLNLGDDSLQLSLTGVGFLIFSRVRLFGIDSASSSSFPLIKAKNWFRRKNSTLFRKNEENMVIIIIMAKSFALKLHHVAYMTIFKRLIWISNCVCVHIWSKCWRSFLIRKISWIRKEWHLYNTIQMATIIDRSISASQLLCNTETLSYFHYFVRFW